jgi:DNA-binding NarL/FixJ family response regulator
VRVVIAEDHALLREGIAALLEDAGIEVVGRSGDAPAFLRDVARHVPDLAIVDVRLPPGFADEGIRAAIEARRRRPDLAVLVLSQYVEPVYTRELLASGEAGVGYLLKERVGDVQGFLEAVRRVAGGGTALDREVIAELVQTRRAADTAIADLTPKELEVLGLMAEGRTNAGIARAMVVSLGAVEKHVTNIFAKLELPAGADDHRRVLAALAYLRAEAMG